ncbi:MAG: hypothetical protein ACOVQ6_11465 [Brevundimonas sp.]
MVFCTQAIHRRDLFRSLSLERADLVERMVMGVVFMLGVAQATLVALWPGSIL